MFYYLLKNQEILSKQDTFTANSFTSNGHVEVVEAQDFQFPKVVFVEGSPEKYTNGAEVTEVKPLIIDTSWTKLEAVAAIEEIPYVAPHWVKDTLTSQVQPVINDETWTHQPYQPAVEAQVEYWENEVEIIYENPNDASYTHHAAIAAQSEVLESWAKDGVIVSTQPVINDDSWTFIPEVPYAQGIPAIPEHWVKDGQEAQYSQPMVLDPTYIVIPAIASGNTIVEDTAKQEAFELAQAKQARAEKGRKHRECCTAVLDAVGGYNDESDFTFEQINQMQVTFADAWNALNAFRANLSKELISAIEPDGVIVTVAFKNELLDIFAQYGF